MATEKEIRAEVVATAKEYIGATQGSKLHRKIIDIFNTVIPDGVKLLYTSYWCAGFASGVEIQTLGKKKAKKICPLSYNCNTIIKKAKKMGIWVEDDAYKPKKAKKCARRNIIVDGKFIRGFVAIPYGDIATKEKKDDKKETIYIVKKGDTLTAIAKKYNTTVKAIAEKNGIKNVNLIITGQKLKI